MSKLFCPFSVSYDCAFYNAFYFMNDPIKTKHDILGFDRLTSKFLTILYFCKALLIIV